MSFRGPADVERIKHLLDEAEAGEARRIAFTAPPGAVWALPLYELALMTAAQLEARGVDVEISLVTPEDEPLAVFGPRAAVAVRELLEERGIAVRTRSYPLEAREGEGTIADLRAKARAHAGPSRRVATSCRYSRPRKKPLTAQNTNGASGATIR